MASTTTDPLLNQPVASNQDAPNMPSTQTLQTPLSSQQQQPPHGKRPRDDVGVQILKFPYCKMRAVLRNVRPHFLEVIRAPQFRDTKAAREIQIYMKLMVDLCRGMSVETMPTMKCDDLPGTQALPTEKNDTQKHDKPVENITHGTSTNPSYPDEDESFVKQQLDNSQIPGTYVVGGSALDWNFITYSSSRPVYYGRTKESFRAAKCDALF